ncbi:MAG TPA: BMP family ABC transporter substrate-binding protein [Roseobacter sp.]|uniref:ABC transporter substrate-binding protein PnrA-like domain-containing protein n=1 Tax=marine sediment metagenome TaxID=412755 RepID=A0A0F9U4T3_9ZZZZ|nr:BMP family ABC transporter substrate-binding protein [Roseobacter sp.]
MKHQFFKGLRIAAGMAALAVPQIAIAQDDVKFAIVMPGVITDNSFNQAGYEGALAASEALGLEMAYSEKVAQPDQPEALADYARRGYNVVIGHGSEFSDSVQRVAKRNPDTSFLIVNGSEATGNISTVGYNYRHLAYGLGLIAGEMSKTGTGGFVGAQQIPFSTNLLEGYTAGFLAANPDGKVLSAWTSDWDDVAKGKEATLNLISQGADMIFPTMDNATIGSLQAMQEQGVQGFGIYYDAIEDWPDTILQSAIFDLSGAMTAVLSNIEDGKLPSKAYEFGFETPEAARFGTFHGDVSADVQDAVNAAIAGMVAGEINP